MDKFIFPFLLENISKLDIATFDKNSISYQIAIDILFSKFRNDLRITPKDIIQFFKFLKDINYKDPQIYKDLIQKYLSISNNIKNYQFHIDIINCLGENGKFELDIEIVSHKVKAVTNKMNSNEKTKLFNSLVKLNNLEHKFLSFFLYSKIEELLNDSQLSQMFSTLLSLFKLKLTYPELNKYDSKVNTFFILDQISNYFDK